MLILTTTAASGSAHLANHSTIERRFLEPVQSHAMMNMNKRNTLSADKVQIEEMNYLFERSVNRVQLLTQQYSEDVDQILRDALEESAKLKQTLMSRDEVQKANAALDKAMAHINEMSDNFHDHIIDSISQTMDAGEVTPDENY